MFCFNLREGDSFELSSTSKGSQTKCLRIASNKGGVFMGENLAYSFDYMLADEVCSTVYVYNDGRVVVDDKTDILIRKPFGNWGSSATYEDVKRLFEERCFPRTRGNCKQILRSGGLDFYNPEEIVRKTKGIMSDDEFWLRFHDA